MPSTANEADTTQADTVSSTRTGTSFLELKMLSAPRPPLTDLLFEGAQDMKPAASGASHDGSASTRLLFALYLSLVVEEKIPKENFRAFREMQNFRKQMYYNPPKSKCLIKMK